MNPPSRAAWQAAGEGTGVAMANGIRLIGEALGVLAGNRALGVWGQTAVALVLAAFIPAVLAVQFVYALLIGLVTLLRHPRPDHPTRDEQDRTAP